MIDESHLAAKPAKAVIGSGCGLIEGDRLRDAHRARRRQVGTKRGSNSHDIVRPAGFLGISLPGKTLKTLSH
jgi:hypothetical protein